MAAIALIYLLSVLLALGIGARLIAAIFSSRSRDAMASHPVAHMLLIGFVIFAWFVPWGLGLGYLAAKWDISRGHYEIAKYGLVRTPLSIYSRLLKERYNIKCSTASGCMVMPSEVEFKNAYNAVAVPAIIDHFGKDVFEECKVAADAVFRAQYGIK